jgi:hypothetical protein
MSRGRNTIAYIALAAAFICLLVYVRALSCGFVNWEDQDYVVNNTAIRSLNKELLVWAFTKTPVASFWLPLTYFSFAMDYHFWGLDPLGYHLTNILLHAANTGLVVLVADRLYRGRSGMEKGEEEPPYIYPAMLLLAALLFGLHPLRVESVAWVTERRGVLNGFFTLSSLLFYLRFQLKRDQAGGNGAGTGDYILSLLLFLFSLMSKPTSIVLPALLLVLDWYPLGRLKPGRRLAVVAEKIPYLVLSAASIAVIVLVKAGEGSFNPLSSFPLSVRVVAAGNALFEYTRLSFYPVDIVPYYDLPRTLPSIFIYKTVAVTLCICLCIYWRKKRPWLAAMALCFYIPIIPTLHFFAGGLQIVHANRYTYLPAIVPSIITAALVASAYRRTPWLRSRPGQILLTGMLMAMLCFYAATSQRLISVWKDSGTMWTRVIEYQAFDMAYFYRGLYYVDSGNYPAAIEDYTTLMTIAGRQQQPDIYNLYAFRGEAYARAGRYEEAVRDFDTAISMFPHALYYQHRGTALSALGRLTDANTDLARAGRAKGQIFWFPAGSSLN